MKNKQEYYSNFKCYNKKGQRLALFGRKINEKLEIFELRCAKIDQFKKEIAYKAYNEWLKIADDVYKTPFAPAYGLFFGTDGKLHKIIEGFRPSIKIVDILKENKPLWTFNQHCKNNYYHKQTITCLYNVEMLKKGFEMKIVNVTKKKMKI